MDFETFTATFPPISLSTTTHCIYAIYYVYAVYSYIGSFQGKKYYYFSVVGGSIKVYMGWFTADLAIWPMKTVPVSVLSTTDIVGFSIATLAEPSWTITQLTNNLRRLRFWSQPDSSHWGLIVIEELQ